jgi:hypothetical protein
VYVYGSGQPYACDKNVSWQLLYACVGEHTEASEVPPKRVEEEGVPWLEDINTCDVQDVACNA